MVHLSHISKQFGDLKVLKDISFHAPRGKTTVVIGPSGSGKSTLLRCINLLETPDAGEVRIANTAVSFDDQNAKSPFHHRLHRRAEILTLRQHTGMVFQGFHLFPHKTILENVMEGPVQVLKRKPEEVRDMALSLLEKVELVDKKDCYPATLSGGQQQRAAIARALGMNPDVLLFDEPTSALDPELEREVLKVIRALVQENNTMIIVTHNLLFAKEIGDLVVFVDSGQITATGAPAEIFGGKTTKRAGEFIAAMLPPMEYVI
ncbi:arginine ABC transporter ATP-binding protein [Spirochaetia bacterium]|nr:arginine ABC transporter ATP-binding protein [Spirochaetia bacterium]